MKMQRVESRTNVLISAHVRRHKNRALCDASFISHPSLPRPSPTDEIQERQRAFPYDGYFAQYGYRQIFSVSLSFALFFSLPTSPPSPPPAPYHPSVACENRGQRRSVLLMMPRSKNASSCNPRNPSAVHPV